MSDKIDTPHYTLWIEDGIIHNVYKPDLIMTIDIAIEMVNHRLKLTNDITYPLFVDIRNLVAIKAEARRYLAGSEAVKYASAGAIYLDNHLLYLVGQVFLKIDNPAIPSRLFTDKEKALHWLETFKNLN